MSDSGAFDDAVDWLLNHGAVDFEMQDRFRAISCGLVTSEEVDDLEHAEVRALLVRAGELTA